MSNAPTMEKMNDGYFIITVNKNGKVWEVRISIDMEDDGGISADIVRDNELCTETGFGWTDKHDNEAQ